MTTEEKALALVNEISGPLGCYNWNDATRVDLIKALTQTIEAHEAFAQRVSEAVVKWQPIETAPKDGTKILGFCDGDVLEIISYGNDWIWDNFMSSQTNWAPIPTHWMPLPTPPSA